MIYKKFLQYFIFFFAIFSTNIALSNNEIYYVDLDYLLNNSLAGKSITKQLNQKKILNTKKFKKIASDLKDEETKLVSQKNILNKDDFKKKVDLFSKKVSTYQANREKAFNDFSNKKNGAQKFFINSLMPILSEFSKENSISYILPKQTIIIGKTELDLTKKILAIVDSKIKTIKLK